MGLSDDERQRLAVKEGIAAGLLLVQAVDRCVFACRAAGARRKGGSNPRVQKALSSAGVAGWLIDGAPTSVRGAHAW
jgi:hypothetical protein